MSKEDIKKEIEYSIILKHYRFTDYRKDEKNNFGVFIVDRTLLHPDIKNKKLIEKEKYELGITSELNKGQYKFDICFHSRIEMLNVYKYLVELGYKYCKIYVESSKYTSEELFTLDEIKEKKKDLNFFGCCNILNVIINSKNLWQFKKDIHSIREKLGYRNVWRGEFLYSYFNNYKIVD